jgi:recombination protein RecA
MRDRTLNLMALPLRRRVLQPLPPARWSRAELAGRLAELSGGPAGAALTLAFGLILDAQLQGETAAWVSAGQGLFYPPDVAEGGVDLGALPVVRVQDAAEAGRAAEHLVRCGAFGLVVLDLGAAEPLPLPLQARLAKLAQRHDAAILCLTRKRGGERSLGPLVSLRAEARRERSGDGGFLCEARALKDKRRGAGWMHQESCRGPEGLRRPGA